MASFFLVFFVIKYIYIDSQQALEQLCSSYEQATVLAVDTEFVRERTLYAKLGLLQAYDGQTLALIDPLAIGDLSPFWQLLENPSIIKVIHAGSEDFEVFKHYGQVTVTPLFDSQVAAALTSMGSSLGYGKLIETLLDVSLDKGESRTNWLARPLREAQLNYAANDVYYLHQAYFKLQQMLEQNGKLAICEQECHRLVNKPTNSLALDKYLDISGSWQLVPEQLAVLQQLAAWRFNEAGRRDLALGFVAKDSELLALASRTPQQISDLHAIKEIHPMVIKRHGKKMLSLVAQGLSQNDLPSKIQRLVDFSAYKQTFKAIKLLVEQVAEEHQIPKEMIASKKIINQVLSYFWIHQQQSKNPPILLNGWRNELVGKKIFDLLSNTKG